MKFNEIELETPEMFAPAYRFGDLDDIDEYQNDESWQPEDREGEEEMFLADLLIFGV